ncbi:MAG: hypothetical protein Q8P51_17350 [Ignavibacteria bacterium]|nr:hypothetical protein [Ignavibacteria bacterium]
MRIAFSGILFYTLVKLIEQFQVQQNPLFTIPPVRFGHAVVRSVPVLLKLRTDFYRTITRAKIYE